MAGHPLCTQALIVEAARGSSAAGGLCHAVSGRSTDSTGCWLWLSDLFLISLREKFFGVWFLWLISWSYRRLNAGSLTWPEKWVFCLTLGQASVARLILSILRGQRWGSTRERSLTVPRSFPVLLAYHRETLSSVWKRKVCFLRGSRSLGWSSGCFALSLGSGVKLGLLQTKLCPHCSDAHKGCREEMSECPGAHRVALSWG